MQNFSVNQPSQFSSPAYPPQKSRTGLYIALGLGVIAIFILLAAGIGGFILYRQMHQPVSSKLVPVMAGYNRGEINTNVTEDLKKDSLEAYTTVYKPTVYSATDKNVTVVMVRYPSKERAEQSVKAKVKAMQEGTISKATVTDSGLQVIRGKTVGIRYALAMAVLDQVVWNENDVFVLVTTSGSGNAVRFENDFLIK